MSPLQSANEGIGPDTSGTKAGETVGNQPPISPENEASAGPHDSPQVVIKVEPTKEGSA